MVYKVHLFNQMKERSIADVDMFILLSEVEYNTCIMYCIHPQCYTQCYIITKTFLLLKEGLASYTRFPSDIENPNRCELSSLPLRPGSRGASYGTSLESF